MRMSQKVILNVPLNRVEGDLEVRVAIEGGRVSDAWSSGTMYRGFEQIMIGRAALDGLVITPRVCGICGASHLTAASRALDMIAGVTPPPNAVRIRNLTLMAEHIQSDLRQVFLMFTADFTNPAYKNSRLFDEAVRRYEPFKGETVVEVLRHTKRLLEIVAIVGGQWPHSSYMVPGGIVSVPGMSDLLQCRLLVKKFRKWYEQRILGCALERWLEVQSAADLETWLGEDEAHRKSDLGFYLRFSREIGLERIGKRDENYLCYGAFDLPPDTQVRSVNGDLDRSQRLFLPAGFVQKGRRYPFDQQHIAEHVAHSWFVDYDGGRHPFKGETLPYASGQEGEKYSWAKAPRYDGVPAETGPVAEMLVAGNPLISDLLEQQGSNVFVRELARLLRPAEFLPVMETWWEETINCDGRFYLSPGEILSGEGFGLTEGPRGALGHWVRIEQGKIEQYQIITPTAWNASPRDSAGVRGPWEEALIGTEVRDMENPVELGHVVRSFDACLVCTVHVLSCKKRMNFFMVE